MLVTLWSSGDGPLCRWNVADAVAVSRRWQGGVLFWGAFKSGSAPEHVPPERELLSFGLGNSFVFGVGIGSRCGGAGFRWGLGFASCGSGWAFKPGSDPGHAPSEALVQFSGDALRCFIFLRGALVPRRCVYLRRRCPLQCCDCWCFLGAKCLGVVFPSVFGGTFWLKIRHMTVVCAAPWVFATGCGRASGVCVLAFRSRVGVANPGVGGTVARRWWCRKGGIGTRR